MCDDGSWSDNLRRPASAREKSDKWRSPFDATVCSMQSSPRQYEMREQYLARHYSRGHSGDPRSLQSHHQAAYQPSLVYRPTTQSNSFSSAVSDFVLALRRRPRIFAAFSVILFAAIGFGVLAAILLRQRRIEGQ